MLFHMLFYAVAYVVTVFATVNPGLAQDTPKSKTKPRPTSGVFRASDRRPVHNRAKISAQGIEQYESKRLVLFTDIPKKDAIPLTHLIDEAYLAWEEYFGALPPDREGTEFQITGYLMSDADKFRKAGLLPVDLPAFDHGRHRGQEFWMNDQPSRYYREHLVLHEGTHCYTTAVDHELLPEIWFIEGIAEHFGTHQTSQDDRTTFRVMPNRRELFTHLGRIKIIEEHRAEQLPLSLIEVRQLPAERFLTPAGYAWSWTLTCFLDQHPVYGPEFRKVAAHCVTGKGRAELNQLLEKPGISREFQWFCADLCHGYDLRFAHISIEEGKPITANHRTCDVEAARGWQSSGLLLRAGKKYRIRARGEFVLATEPKQWVSQAAGVSIRYHAGLPLGRMVGRLWPKDPDKTVALAPLNLGDNGIVEPQFDSTLYLRLNDAFNLLGDNSGAVQVEVEELLENE